MKILNLYAGIGGNRKLWGDTHNITAVELNPQIAKIYQDFFPKDKIIVADAHQYLLEHFKEFEFIWSSPPCPSHSVCNFFLHAQGIIRYPDMSLWQEIVFLKHFCKTQYVVENVKPYYEPFIQPQQVGRHCFWANFLITTIPQPRNSIGKFHDMGGKRTKRQSQEERNCVNSELGLHILNESQRNIQAELFSPQQERKIK
jgi:DNA (cytosine-5)-methyltransferase 1